MLLRTGGWASEETQHHGNAVWRLPFVPSRGGAYLTGWFGRKTVAWPWVAVSRTLSRLCCGPEGGDSCCPPGPPGVLTLPSRPEPPRGGRAGSCFLQFLMLCANGLLCHLPGVHAPQGQGLSLVSFRPPRTGHDAVCILIM